MSTKIRVLLADDHPVFRAGVKALLETTPDMSVVGEAADGEEAVKVACSLAPDVVVMDLAMPRLGGAAATARIKAEQPATKVIVLSGYRERAHVQAVLAAGATGYMQKDVACDELVQAVRAVASGAVYLDATAAAQLTPLVRPAGGKDAPRLSEREAQVLRGIAEGRAMKEIAAELDVSARTLETYKTRAMEKLGLATRADIVRYATQCGWLSGN